MRVTDEAAPQQVRTIGPRIVDATIGISGRMLCPFGRPLEQAWVPAIVSSRGPRRAPRRACGNLSSVRLQALIVACVEVLMSYRQARGAEDCFLRGDWVL